MVESTPSLFPAYKEEVVAYSAVWAVRKSPHEDGKSAVPASRRQEEHPSRLKTSRTEPLKRSVPALLSGRRAHLPFTVKESPLKKKKHFREIGLRGSIYPHMRTIVMYSSSVIEVRGKIHQVVRT